MELKICETKKARDVSYECLKFCVPFEGYNAWSQEICNLAAINLISNSAEFHRLFERQLKERIKDWNEEYAMIISWPV